MSAPDLRLVEACDPPIIGNTLLMEESIGGDRAVFLCVHGSDEDPVKKGRTM